MKNYISITTRDELKRLFYSFMVTTILCFISSVTIAQHIEEAVQLNTKGLFYLECGNYEKAYEYFMLALQHDPTNKLLYNNCAVACMNMKKYQEAYRMLSIALAIDPYYVKALSNMAIVNFHLLKFADAYSYYSKALMVDSSYTKERFRLDKVIAGVKKVQSENPENDDLKEIVRQLEILKNNNQDIYSK